MEAYPRPWKRSEVDSINSGPILSNLVRTQKKQVNKQGKKTNLGSSLTPREVHGY